MWSMRSKDWVIIFLCTLSILKNRRPWWKNTMKLMILRTFCIRIKSNLSSLITLWTLIRNDFLSLIPIFSFLLILNIWKLLTRDPLISLSKFCRWIQGSILKKRQNLCAREWLISRGKIQVLSKVILMSFWLQKKRKYRVLNMMFYFNFKSSVLNK